MIDFTRPLSLYIHFPFCRRKCGYCAFYSLPRLSYDDETVEKYVNKILSDLDSLNEIWGRGYRTIYLGGGNPVLAGIDNINRILDKAYEKGLPEEVTIEINPEDISRQRIRNLAYVTRVSTGIQSFDEKALAVLERASSRDENIRALEILKEEGINFNADLITSVPSLDPSVTVRDIEIISHFTPPHISFYSLQYEEGTRMYELSGKRDEEYEEKCIRNGWSRLSDLGYEHYEISNFAIGEKYSLHNLNYWALGQYAGLGPSSESSFGYRNITSVRNSQSVFEYISESVYEKESLSASQSVCEYLLTALRTKWGIDKDEFFRRFDLSFDEVFNNALSNIDNRMYIDSRKSFRLNEEGFLFSDAVISSLAMAVL
ncbi:MAG TPA: coproporphyrinogen III oxidase family protein [Candidatus Ornithospirochaeta avicola]|uniref:Heme chaperone HemW n=1 Tax=Candidatus Ornithospirochaeta avicola TaxID=2840896 RepID=A0A9D1PRS3_9SPIO|nr:coproporphyrinogen III oxidase family protein [Candidatus Ornithospirochaeta avicola]